MAKNLAEQLERLSGYRHPFKPHDANARFNPVNFMHLKLTIAGRGHHLLSRICDAGVDYSKRTNKLAHHVAIEERERTRGGPASVLLADGFCEAEWNGKTAILPQGRTVRESAEWANRRAKPCTYWAKATGDAGWAGVLAEAVLDPKSSPVWVIFRPGQQMLPLVAEAISLLPENKRWDATFSTFYTGLPSGVECRWRFLLDGTPEAKQVRRDVRATRVDLCGRMPRATGGPLVEVARTGVSVSSTPSPTSSTFDIAGSSVQLPGSGSNIPKPPVAQPAESRSMPRPAPVPAPSATTEFHSGEISSGTLRSPNIEIDERFESGSRLFRRVLYAICALAAFVLFGGVMYFAGAHYGRDSEMLATRNIVGAEATSSDDDEEVDDSGEVDASMSTSQLPGSEELADLGGLAEPEDEAPDSTGEVSGGASEPDDADDAEADNEESTEDEAEFSSDDAVDSDEETDESGLTSGVAKEVRPLDDIREQNNILSLPDLHSSDEHVLARLFLEANDECHLELVGLNEIFPPNVGTVAFEQQPNSDSGAPEWHLRVSLFGKTTKRARTLAVFRIDEQQLKFEWRADLQSNRIRPEHLRLCALKISARGDNEICQLLKPIRTESLRVMSDHSGGSVYPFVRHALIEFPKSLDRLYRAQFYALNLPQMRNRPKRQTVFLDDRFELALHMPVKLDGDVEDWAGDEGAERTTRVRIWSAFQLDDKEPASRDRSQYRLESRLYEAIDLVIHDGRTTEPFSAIAFPTTVDKIRAIRNERSGKVTNLTNDVGELRGQLENKDAEIKTLKKSLAPLVQRLNIIKSTDPGDPPKFDTSGVCGEKCGLAKGRNRVQTPAQRF